MPARVRRRPWIDVPPAAPANALDSLRRRTPGNETEGDAHMGLAIRLTTAVAVVFVLAMLALTYWATAAQAGTCGTCV